VASSPARISDTAQEKVRLCILAARLRTRRMKFTDIATELGFASPEAAKQAVNMGLALVPVEDLGMARREAAEELDEMTRGAWVVIDSPGYATTVSGKLIIDPETGRPMPDRQAEIAARRLLLAIHMERRKLLGVDAPKQSISFTGSIEDLRAEVERKERELAAVERGGAVPVLPGRGDRE